MVPYSGGTAQVLNDVMGGRIPIAIDAYSGVGGAIENGTVRPLAIAATVPGATRQRPTADRLSETIPGSKPVGWQVLLAPAGTPGTNRAKGQWPCDQGAARAGNAQQAHAARPRRAPTVARRDTRVRPSRAADLGADRAADRPCALKAGPITTVHSSRRARHETATPPFSTADCRRCRASGGISRSAFAQAYPSRPITMDRAVRGGRADRRVARILAEPMRRRSVRP